ncbi:MAG: hypothetical protein KBF80_09505 [Flavobacteriales bacterium]|nr:hypothetical protein [Flavobacteriales bacterium]
MRNRLRAAWLVVQATLALALPGQTIRINSDTVDATDVNARRLWEGEVRVVGQGSKVPGMDLTDRRNARHWIGDDTAFAARTYVDTAWAKLGSSMDSVAPGATVHWVRYHILPDTSLKGDPMLLNVQVDGGFTLYLNGQFLLRSDPRPVPHGKANVLPGLSVPFSFRCDGAIEVLAFRILVPPGINLEDAGLHVTLHAADSAFGMQRSLMNYGLFIGINLIILLMALVTAWSERKGRGWLLLAGLSFVSVVDTVCVLGGSMGALGLPFGVAEVLRLCRLLTVPWGMYLLIVVLLELRTEFTPKRSRWYAAGILTLTSIVLPVIFSVPFVVSGTSITFPEKELGDNVVLVLAIILCSLVVLSILAWFVVEEVRLGIKLWRTKGHARWVGAGAVAASLMTLLLAVAGELAGLGLSRWLAVLADYCSFVAVPISVAIYLSIRSAHHTRLVTRQRDELDREVQDRTAELRREKERSDELLHNILPHEVAEELKYTGASAARHFDEATVLFSDFRGFTQLSERLSPEELVREIDTCFKHFDGLMDTWRMEKIKTIGDSYMAAGGLPDPGKGGPADVVRAALAMQDYMQDLADRRKASGLPVFHMRVGIHSGPVVAGIVGVKKFQYDIWGDTVNTASRMESSGEEGRVNISASLYERVREEPDLAFEPRGKVHAKGKGELEMYFFSRATAPMPASSGDR